MNTIRHGLAHDIERGGADLYLVHPSVVDGYMMADRFAAALGC